MKRNIFVLTMVSVIVFIFTATSALAWNPFQPSAEKAEILIQKAVQLREMDLNMQAEAKFQEVQKILVQALEKNTNDLDALFVLAKCQYYQNNKIQAEKKFRITYSRNSRKFGPKIFSFYQAESKRNMEIGRLSASLNLAVKSYDFQPDKTRHDKAAEELFRVGSKHLFAGAISTASLYYVAALRLNCDYRPAIAGAFISAAIRDNFSPKNKIYLLHLALRQNIPGQKKKIIKALKKIGQEFKKKKIHRQEVVSELSRLPKKYQLILINITWPITWKTIWGPKEFICIGFIGGVDGTGRIYTIPGNILNIGYKVIIKAKSRYFEIWRSGGWKRYKTVEIINKNSSGQGHVAIRGPAGEKVTAKVEKFIRLNY